MTWCRYALHVGKGRSWQVEPADPEHELEVHDDLAALRRTAQKLQEEWDWWIIFDADDGMSHNCGWSTGRTTPNLMEIDRAHALLRSA